MHQAATRGDQGAVVREQTERFGRTTQKPERHSREYKWRTIVEIEAGVERRLEKLICVEGHFCIVQYSH